MMKPGVLVISHGSREPSWVALVEEAVTAMAERCHLPVSASYLELVDGKLIQDGIDLLEGQGVTDMLVIPLFISSGSTHVDEIAYAIGAKPEPDMETDLDPFRVQARVHFGDPFDDGADTAAMVWDKVRSLSVNPAEEIILMVGHGSPHELFWRRWEKIAASLAKRVTEVSGLATDWALLNPGDVREKAEAWQKRGYEVIVSPLFLSKGYFTDHVIPQRLEGLPCRYSGEPLLPHPRLAEWMLKQVERLLKSLKL
ncbi:sirohydrochlorin chelatase [Paenibacillus sp. JSM ZJ436]|uniref:sirohydrochlorin chelatase n=1 Tax=Paenibacillus sp. JSM ZJ436 TaxID=3376190 RepID=UPI0037A76BA3